MEYNEHSNIGSDDSMANSGHFRDYEFIPAVVIENDDPLNYNRIKVTAPGTFNGNNTDIELLPWCYPWFMFGNATYSTMEKGSKVWLIKNEKRHDECWYLPMYELHTSAQEFINEHDIHKKSEMSYRNIGGGNDFIRWNNNASAEVESGKSNAHASKAGINLTSGSGGVNINNSGKVSIGPSGASESEPVILGYTLINKLDELTDIIITILNELEANVPDYSTVMAENLRNTCQELKSSFETILSETVTINETHRAESLVNWGMRKEEFDTYVKENAATAAKTRTNYYASKDVDTALANISVINNH